MTTSVSTAGIIVQLEGIEAEAMEGINVPANGNNVANSLNELRCTRIVIAYGLSTVRHCDRILVVDGGRISNGGLFAELVVRQRLEDASDDGH